MRVHGGMSHVRSQLRQHSCHRMRSCCAICKVPSMQQGSVASLHHVEALDPVLRCLDVIRCIKHDLDSSCSAVPGHRGHL